MHHFPDSVNRSTICRALDLKPSRRGGRVLWNLVFYVNRAELEISLFTDVDHHIGWSTVDLARIADGTRIQTGDSINRFQERLMRVPEHHDIAVAVLRFIDDAGYPHIDPIVVAMGQKAAMLSDFYDDLLRQ